jgi:xanthine dehydrogenase YagS FAD-binding subunit
MRDFAYTPVRDVDHAIVASERPNIRFIAGGTCLVDLMKLDVEDPEEIVDINRVPLADISETADGGLKIGALARNSTVARHPLVFERYPILAEALLSGASAQLRNMATVGGNLMQRTRCTYFRDVHQACNKRTPGSGCGAADGFHRMHAILGTSEQCFATHPSDMSVALMVLDAVIEVQGPKGFRELPIGEFHTLPGETPHLETVLQCDELITAVALPPVSAEYKSRYRKIRDRESYEFALASVAAMIAMSGATIASARLAFGGVATKPWRASEAERVITGARASVDTFRAAAEASVAGAVPRRDNRFKVELLKRTIIRCLSELTGVTS